MLGQDQATVLVVQGERADERDDFAYEACVSALLF